MSDSRVRIPNENLIGRGIYTPQEVAYYARVRTDTINRWMYGNRRGQRVLVPEVADGADRIATFVDFVQALAVRAIRRDHNVPLQRIRDAVDHARNRYDVRYPFAMPHRTFLFGREIVIELDKLSLGDEPDLVQVSGRQKDQLVLHKVAEPYLTDLTFSEEEIATAYLAFEYKNRRVVMDAKKRLGQPIVADTGYSVHAILDAYRSEGSEEAASNVLGIELDDVHLAIRYHDYLKGPIAA